MDGRLNFNLDRGGYLPSSPASAALGTLGHSYDGNSGAMRQQLADLTRAATPSTYGSLGQYGGRYFPSSSLPYHTNTGYVMDSYLGGRPSTGSEALKSALHQYPQYWAAQSEGLARQYGLTSGLYSPYLPLMHGADPMAAMYPHAAITQSPYHRIYDLRTDPGYTGLSVPAGQSAMYGPGLHSAGSESLLVPGPPPPMITPEGKHEGPSSLEKLSQAVESAGGMNLVAKRRSIKTEPGTAKDCAGKNSSASKTADTKREKKSASSESKRDGKDSKDLTAAKEPSGNSKSKKDSSGSQSSVQSKTVMVLPQGDKVEGNKTGESRVDCDKRASSPLKKRARDTSNDTCDVPKPKAVVHGNKATVEGSSCHSPDFCSKAMETNVPVTSSLSVTALTTVTYTTSDSKAVMSSAKTDTAVYSVQPAARMTPMATSEASVVSTEASEYLGSGPYHTKYSYTQQNRPVKEGSKVHATTVTPEVGTLPSPVVPTCTSTVITAKHSAKDEEKCKEIKCKVEGSRTACCAATTTSSAGRTPSKSVDSQAQSAKRKMADGKHKSAADKSSKIVNQHEKLSEQLSSSASAKYEDSGGFLPGAPHILYPGALDCHPRDIYGNPLPFPHKSLAYPGAPGMTYDPSLRPIDLSSPKEKRRKEKVKSPSENSRESTSSEGGKSSEHSSSVPYRDIIHEYGQPRSHVTLLETHLPATPEDKAISAPSKSPVPVEAAQRLWYDYGVAGRYVYPYSHVQPYYPVAGGVEKLEGQSAPGSRSSPRPCSRPASRPSSRSSSRPSRPASNASNVHAGPAKDSGKEDNSSGKEESSSSDAVVDNGKGQVCDAKDDNTVADLPVKEEPVTSPLCKANENCESSEKTDSECNSASASPTRPMSPCPSSQPPVETSERGPGAAGVKDEVTTSRYLASLRTCQTRKKNKSHLPRNPVKPTGPGLKTLPDTGDDSVAISGSGIPVGIAVARQRQEVTKEVVKEEVNTESVVATETCSFSQERSEREEFLREQKELLENHCHVTSVVTSTSAADLSANLVVTGGNVLSAGTGWRDGTEAARQFSANQWLQAGHALNPALWVGQATFGMPPALPPTIPPAQTLPTTPTIDPSHLPFTAAASAGFKLAQDPVTGQLFLIPATNLAYASTPFQHATSTAQTVMAAQPFPPMAAVTSQPITAPQPPIDQSNTAENSDKDQTSQPPSDPTEASSDEALSGRSGTPSRAPSPGTEHTAEQDTSQGEATQAATEGEKAECPAPVAPQTAFIAGYPALGTAQTYTAYPYATPQFSYLYDTSMLSTYSMPMAAAAIPETPVAAVKPECPAVRSQGTSPIVVGSTAPTIPTATVTAFCGAPEVTSPPTETEKLPESEVVEEDKNSQVTTEDQLSSTTPDSQTEQQVSVKQEEPETPTVAPVAPVAPAAVVAPMVVPKEESLEEAQTAEDPITISESVGAAEVLQKMKHAKIKKDKKKKGKSEKRLDKKSEKKSGKKHSGEKKAKSEKTHSGDKESSTSEKKRDKSGKVKKSKLKSKSKTSHKDTRDGKCDKDSGNYNPYTDPQILQAADGLELLSALAEKRAKCSPVEEELLPNKPGVIDAYEFTDTPVVDINRNYSPSKTGKRTCYADPERLASPTAEELPEPSPMFHSASIPWPIGADTMDTIELEMRMRVAELQRRFRQKQRELAKITPKNEKEEEDRSLAKRGPGRPRKRKFLSRKSDSQNTSASDSGKSSGCKEPVTKKKKLVEKLVDRVFRKTGRDKSGKSKKNKGFGLLMTNKQSAGGSLNGAERLALVDAQAGGGKGPLKKAKIRPSDPSKVKSKIKSKDGKKLKSGTTQDSSKIKKKSAAGLGHSSKEKKAKRHSFNPEDVELSSDANPGLSDSSDADCGLGLLAKYASSAMESATSPHRRKRPLEEESDTDHSDPTSVSKRRKPGRPKKYCNPGKSAGNTETIVAKKPKNLGLMKLKNKDRKLDLKAQERKMKLENSSVLKPLYLEEEWCLRRSERIFLSEPSPQPSPNDIPHPASHAHGDAKTPRARSKSMDKPKPKVNRSKSLQDISHKVKLKYSKSFQKKVSGFVQSRLSKVDAYGRRPGKFGQFYVDSDSNTESSDGDDLPLSTLRDRAVTPEPQSCVLNKEDLVDGLRVLLLMDGLFHEGAVKAIRPPDVYGVLIDGERGNRPHIYSQEEILKEAILDVSPGSPRFVPEGTRVCAYWSQQFSCLYPGTVSKGSPNPHTNPSLISLEFDDGDSGKIPFDHIRMLPANYPHVCYDRNPILIMGKRRRRTASEDLEYCRSSASELSPIPGSAAIRWPKYRTPLSKVRAVSDKGTKGGSLFGLMEEGELNDSVFDSGSRAFGQSLSQDKKVKKKHKHKSKEDGTDHKHKHKKHKKLANKDEKSHPAALFSGPETSFASLAQSDACHTMVSGGKSLTDACHTMVTGGKSLGVSGFLMQSTSYEEKTYNWVMRNPLTIDPGAESAGDEATSVSNTNNGSGVDDSDTDDEYEVTTAAQPKPKGRPRSQPTKEKSKSVEQPVTPDVQALLQRRLWKWLGKSTKRPGMKGKARKEFYKAIQRGEEVIRVGDCAVFLSTGRPNLPFVGRIENFWESWGGNMVVRVKWFYHPEETKGGRKLPEPKGALFQSPHGDENGVQTISHGCRVLSYMEYNRLKHEAIRSGTEYILDNKELYYLAGNYDPSLNHISYEPHVLG